MSQSPSALNVSLTQVAGQHSRGDDVFPRIYQNHTTNATLDTTCAWVANHRERLLTEAERFGVVMFRGLPLHTAEDFDHFVTAFGLPPFTYEDSLSNAVRVSRTPRVFTANEAPPSAQIFFHHEMAQTPFYPRRLFFFCEQPAASGGATPVCRSDWLCEQLGKTVPQFLACVDHYGLRYTNVMPGQDDPQSGMGRSWQSTLKSSSREGAEHRLRELNYTWQWLDDGCLRATTPVLPGVLHLNDGRRTFFNQLIAAYCGWKDTRNDPSQAITLGNGAPLDPLGVQHAVRLAEKYAFDVPWLAGDVALVDNLVAMHGRRTFSGTRKVLAAMV